MSPSQTPCSHPEPHCSHSQSLCSCPRPQNPHPTSLCPQPGPNAPVLDPTPVIPASPSCTPVFQVPHPSVLSTPAPYPSVPSAPHPCGRLPRCPCARTGARCAVGAPSAGTHKCKPGAARTPRARPGNKLRGDRSGRGQGELRVPAQAPSKKIPTLRVNNLPSLPLRGDADFPGSPRKGLRPARIPTDGTQNAAPEGSQSPSRLPKLPLSTSPTLAPSAPPPVGTPAACRYTSPWCPIRLPAFGTPKTPRSLLPPWSEHARTPRPLHSPDPTTCHGGPRTLRPQPLVPPFPPLVMPAPVLPSPPSVALGPPFPPLVMAPPDPPGPHGADATAEAGDRHGQPSADPRDAHPEEQAASMERLSGRCVCRPSLAQQPQ